MFTPHNKQKGGSMKGKGKTKVQTVNPKRKPQIHVAKGSPTQGDNPYGSGAGDPTAYPGGHAAKGKIKK
jgi:hypothetical protein